MTKSPKLLVGKEDIKAFLGNISDHLFRKYVEKGLPARYEDRRWVAHADNIDEFMKSYTRISMKKMPDEEENGEA